MRNILILITLIIGLISTSFIKNKTRLLEKELLYLDNEISSLSSKLSEASLDFQYLTAPKHISFLAENFLDEDFSFYKEFQIKIPKNGNTFSKLGIEESVKQEVNIAEEIDNTRLLITKRIDNVTKGIDNEKSQKSKKTEVSQKVRNWAGLQIVKVLLGIPSIPVK